MITEEGPLIDKYHRVKAELSFDLSGYNLLDDDIPFCVKYSCYLREKAVVFL
jgi:hypothetical protein